MPDIFRAAAPTAPLILEDEAESTPEATAVIQCLDTNDLLNTSEPIRYNPPAYSTLPTSGHRSIAVAPQTENCDFVGVNDLFFGPHDNIRLQRSDLCCLLFRSQYQVYSNQLDISKKYQIMMGKNISNFNSAPQLRSHQ